MTDPWVGDGPDPWLPDRLAYAQQAAAAEMAVREQVWSELSAWLVKASRAVMRSVVPDPYAIYSVEPAWAAAVERIVSGSITDAISSTHTRIFGPEYPVNSRPMVVDHLAKTSNRMVATAEQTFDLVASEVATGSGLGESIPEIAARIDETLSATGTANWTNRATVIARTETLSALNAGRTDAFAALSDVLGGGDYEQVWISTIDRRTRPTHKVADGQRVPLGTPFTVGGASLRYPGDPDGPGKEIIQCRCSSIMVEPGEAIDLSNRQYKHKGA